MKSGKTYICNTTVTDATTITAATTITNIAKNSATAGAQTAAAAAPLALFAAYGVSRILTVLCQELKTITFTHISQVCSSRWCWFLKS